MQTTTCTACGAEIEFGYVFCVQCGERLPEETAGAPMDDEVAAEVAAEPVDEGSPEDAFFNEEPGVDTVDEVVADVAAAVEPPAPSEAERSTVEGEPVAVEPEPVAVEPEPPAPPASSEAERSTVEGEPVAVEPEPEPAKRWEMTIQVLKSFSGEKRTERFTTDSLLVGREGADLAFPEDHHLESPHLRLSVIDGHMKAEDLSSCNGFYKRVTSPVELVHGTRFLVGEQVLRFDYFNPVRILKMQDGTYFCGSATPPWKFRVVQLLKGDVEGSVYCFSAKHVTMGREDSEINFGDDRFISYEHAEIESRGGRYYLNDRNSRNGTYVQVENSEHLAKGDIVALGRALLRVDYSAI
jgi:hypothetical protein